MVALKEINIRQILSEGVCALCGNGVHIDDHEGRVACNGCNMATDNCTCGGEDLTTKGESAGRRVKR